MIDFEKAIDLILENTPAPRIETRSISDSLGFVLAEDIRARESIPLFDSSAMDGFAVFCSDVEGASEENPVTIPLQGEVRAGDQSETTLKENHAIRIMTGAPAPNGAEAVVMKEYVNDLGNAIEVKRSAKHGENIRRRGEEIKEGDKALLTGEILTPPAIGLIATLGYETIKLFKRPSVALIVTGDELQSPGSELKPGMIRDSNSFAISAALKTMGIKVACTSWIKDQQQDLEHAFESGLEQADILITVGGVSVGDYDYVKDTAARQGIETVFWRVAIKPGKPNLFGKRDDKLVFGLPGNPVSAMVSFLQFVRPAIRKLTGIKEPLAVLKTARLKADLKKKPKRMEFIRGVACRNSDDELEVTPVSLQGSHMISGLAKANCLIHFPTKESKLEKDCFVKIELIEWSEL